MITVGISKKFIGNFSCSDTPSIKIMKNNCSNEKHYFIFVKREQKINDSLDISCVLNIDDVIFDKIYSSYGYIFDVLNNNTQNDDTKYILLINTYPLCTHIYDIKFDVSFKRHEDVSFDLFLICLDLDTINVSKLNIFAREAKLYNDMKDNYKNIEKKIKYNMKSTKRLNKKLTLIKNKRKIRTLFAKIMHNEKERIFLEQYNIMYIFNVPNKTHEYFTQRRFLFENDIRNYIINMKCCEEIKNIAL